MSEQLTAAANALGIPESLVERSAAARAAETGASSEEILAAWAGGAPAPETIRSGPDDEPAEPEPAGEILDEPERAQTSPEIVVEVPTEAPGPRVPGPDEAAVAGPYKPPVLVDTEDNPMVILAATVGLFVVVFLVGLVGPSFLGEAPGTRSSEIEYSSQALEGRDVYASLNCDSCHTQMVRPVIADVGLGEVTVHDTNQILGTRRFGPDLSDIGSRVTSSQLSAIVGGLGDHPGYVLSQEDLDALVTYLAESSTSEAS